MCIVPQVIRSDTYFSPVIFAIREEVEGKGKEEGEWGGEGKEGGGGRERRRGRE